MTKRNDSLLAKVLLKVYDKTGIKFDVLKIHNEYGKMVPVFPYRLTNYKYGIELFVTHVEEKESDIFVYTTITSLVDGSTIEKSFISTKKIIKVLNKWRKIVQKMYFNNVTFRVFATKFFKEKIKNFKVETNVQKGNTVFKYQKNNIEFRFRINHMNGRFDFSFSRIDNENLSPKMIEYLNEKIKFLWAETHRLNKVA